MVSTDEEKGLSRRRLLRSAILFSAVGAGVLLGVDRLARGETTSASGGKDPSSGASLRVKAMYFQMPLAISIKEEYFTLQSPAYLRDLLSIVTEEHPPLSPMMPTMMILIDGVVGKPATPLNDGDEVDFIPAIAGG